jgi:hypothetical protein
MRPAGRIRSGAASEYPRAASSGAAARARSRSRGLFALPFALGVVTLVVGVVAVPRAVARDPRRRRVEPAASTQRLHCLPHSLVRRLVHRLFARHCFAQGLVSPPAPGQSQLRSGCVWRKCKEPLPEKGSGSSTSGLFEVLPTALRPPPLRSASGCHRSVLRTWRHTAVHGSPLRESGIPGDPPSARSSRSKYTERAEYSGTGDVRLRGPFRRVHLRVT